VSQTTFYSATGEPLPSSLTGVPTLAGNVAAVGSTNPSGGHRITLYDATTGTQLAEVDVGGNADEFDIAGADSHWVVFRLGVTIYGLNTSSDQVARLTRAKNDPVGLSVSGRLVAWAENTYSGDHGRIRVLDLPS
jgi:hypothetical protein